MIERGVEIDGYIYHPDYNGEQIPVVIEERENVSILKRIVLSTGDLIKKNLYLFILNIRIPKSLYLS